MTGVAYEAGYAYHFGASVITTGLLFFDPEKNVSSPEDIILSEHVEESLPHELCDIP
jgi:hypothetical protein